ncbi:hypothetical protein POTOM_020358 [Populus tomentosa]|uniref:Uncharacterized protein n=1 Tax=Populus tomentosa TaxID=118781 RepID=A0A8X8D1Z5_POPTO|nr:hypothetical protein POTOM_020358 [Populus tomentosa]
MNLSNLKFFACDNNELIAAPSFQPLVPKFQLRAFSASNCTPKQLKAGFPNFLQSQHDLMFVDLSHNKFVGEPFLSWLFENNRKLNRLYLRDTSFRGPLQLPQHPTPTLQTVDMSGNNIHGQIARNICSIFPSLKNFMMANNSLTGCIPPCFGNISSLAYLDLSNNHMSCELLEHNLPTSLWFLKLSNNNFKGRLPLSVLNMTDLHYLFLDGNIFAGQVSGTFSLASSFMWFDISNNLLSGMLPRGIGNSSISLQGIDLCRNHFEGTIPIEYFNSSGLEFLDLSENNLSGSLPLGFHASDLRYVHLYRNQLSGPLAYDFYNLSSLVTLDLGDNNLTGPIPNWIDSLSELSIFVLKSNQFNGKLPHQLCLLRKLSILDLSENNFSGLLPSCLSNFNFTASDEKTWVNTFTMTEDDGIRKDIFGNVAFYLDIRSLLPEISVKISVELTSKKNFYTYEGGNLRYLSALDLSCNRFTGEIPTEWGKSSGIYSLNLSQNNLTGLIPSSFSNLKHIESLDLSHNNLNGRIPAQLVELNFLSVFNVSYNNLSGRTPEMKYQFATINESSYKGNSLLCGPPLQNSCDKTESPSVRVPNNSNGDDGLIDMDSFYASFGVCYIIVVLTFEAVLCINPYWRHRWFYFIEECIDTCYCFLAINFRKLSRFRSAFNFNNVMSLGGNLAKLFRFEGDRTINSGWHRFPTCHNFFRKEIIRKVLANPRWLGFGSESGSKRFGGLGSCPDQRGLGQCPDLRWLGFGTWLDPRGLRIGACPDPGWLGDGSISEPKGVGSVSRPKLVGVWVLRCPDPRGLGPSVYEPKGVGGWIRVWTQRSWGCGPLAAGPKGFGSFRVLI